MASAPVAVLHLRVGDPLPELPLQPALRLRDAGTYTLLCSVGVASAADAAAHVARAEALVAARRGVRVVVALRGDGAVDTTVDAAAAERVLVHLDADGAFADRLGALASADGVRADVCVLVEPRGSVCASVVGGDADAWDAALAPLPA